jgi:hypothetical protein
MPLCYFSTACCLYDSTEIIWLQIGAAPHYGLRIRDLLINHSPEWIGQLNAVCCPISPLSCYLTSWDFS